jgi:hypothetical protein
MKPALALCLAAGLAASGTLYGQAMIEYGVGIGRAGAAGAATGAGAAGIFSGVKGSLEQKPNTAQPRQATAEEIEKAKKTGKDKSEAASVAKTSEEKKEEKPAEPASWDFGTLTTSSGFVISGLQRRPTRAAYGPSSAGPVVEVPPAQTAQSASGEAAGPVPASDHAATAQTASAGNGAPSTSGVFQPIVTQFGDARVEVSKPGTALKSDKVAAVDIPVGTPVDELMKRFGEPLLALTGVSGEAYTEKYVFKTPDGARLTVLSVHGKVTNVVVETDSGTRAAL